MKTKINIWAEKHIEFDNHSNFFAFYKLVEKWIMNFPDIIFERKTFLSYKERDKINQYPLEFKKFIVVNGLPRTGVPLLSKSIPLGAPENATLNQFVVVPSSCF